MKRIGILTFTTILAVLLLVGCTGQGGAPLSSLSPTGPDAADGLSTGNIQVLVTDAPGDVSAVNVTVSEVEIHRAGDGEAAGEWIPLGIANEGQPFNLLDLQDGLNMLIAEGNSLEPGEFTQLRMTVFEVIVMTEDGPEEGYQAIVPSEKLKFVRPFTLEGGDTISLIVDMDAAKSVIFTGADNGNGPKVIFKPVVKLAIQHEDQEDEEETEEEGLAAEFDPTIGPVTTVINVTGEEWADDETIDSVAIGGETAVNDLVVDSEGNLSGTIMVPTLDPGTYAIMIEGSESGVQEFLDAFTVTATALFDPESGPVETVVTVTGAGWAADDTLVSVLVGGEAAVNNLTVDSGGNLSGTLTIPGALTADIYDIEIEGSASGVQLFTDAFTVTE